MNKECQQCLIDSFDKLLENKISNRKIKIALINKIKNHTKKINSETIAPEAAREIHYLVSKHLRNNDLYKEEKKLSNDIALIQYPVLKTPYQFIKLIQLLLQILYSLRIIFAMVCNCIFVVPS